MGDRKSLAADTTPDDQISLDELDFAPHFQRVSISGEDTSGVPLEDLGTCLTSVHTIVRATRKIYEYVAANLPNNNRQIFKINSRKGHFQLHQT